MRTSAGRKDARQRNFLCQAAVLALQACLQIRTVMTIRHTRLAGTPEEAVDTTFSAPELICFLALHLVVANGALLGAGLF